jgi:hypothetical protein
MLKQLLLACFLKNNHQQNEIEQTQIETQMDD